VSELPSGTVTMLFSDIEGSTRLLQHLGGAWGDVVGAHNRILRTAFSSAGGQEVDRQGDAFFAVFASAREAVAAAVHAQRELATATWPEDVAVRVRMGIHTGEPTVGEEGYLGLDVVRAARICGVARGGQVLLSETTRALLGRGAVDGTEVRELGEVELKDIEDRERLWELVVPGLAAVPEPVEAEAGGAGEPAPFAGHESELAAGALRARDELWLDALEGFDAAIQQHVDAALRDATAAARAQRAASRPGWHVHPGWVIGIGAAVVVPVVWLLLDQL
jgi:class 3 adenylate cyclase